MKMLEKLTELTEEIDALTRLNKRLEKVRGQLKILHTFTAILLILNAGLAYWLMLHFIFKLS